MDSIKDVGRQAAREAWPGPGESIDSAVDRMSDAVMRAALQLLLAEIPGDDGREFIQSYIDQLALSPPSGAQEPPQMCMVKNGIFICTREAGHDGDHQDRNADGSVGIGWAQEKPQVVDLMGALRKSLESLERKPSQPSGEAAKVETPTTLEDRVKQLEAVAHAPVDLKPAVVGIVKAELAERRVYCRHGSYGGYCPHCDGWPSDPLPPAVPLAPTPPSSTDDSMRNTCTNCGRYHDGPCAPTPPETEYDPIQHAVDHWFTQGGKAQFGMIAANNADELISAILDRVRNPKPDEPSPSPGAVETPEGYGAWDWLDELADSSSYENEARQSWAREIRAEVERLRSGGTHDLAAQLVEREAEIARLTKEQLPLFELGYETGVNRAAWDWKVQPIQRAEPPTLRQAFAAYLKAQTGSETP